MVLQEEEESAHNGFGPNVQLKNLRKRGGMPDCELPRLRSESRLLSATGRNSIHP